MSELVTYEQARQLKRLNFRRRSRAYYIDGNLDYNNPINWNTNEGLDENGEYQEEDGYCSAPTVSDALDFIREEKNIACGVHPFQRHNDKGKFICWDYTYAAFRNEEDLLENNANYISLIYPTHPEAESALLTTVLEYLEK